MGAQPSEEAGGLRFVDPSVDPAILSESAERLIDVGVDYAILRAARELIIRIRDVVTRFPKVEYSVGLDGIDDCIRVENLDTTGSYLEIEAKIWVSSDSRDGVVLDVRDDDGERIVTLAQSSGTSSGFTLFYAGTGGIQDIALPLMTAERWQVLSICLDSNALWVELDGRQVAMEPLRRDETKIGRLQFGSSAQQGKYIKGMIKSLGVATQNRELLDWEAGGEDPVRAQFIGVREMRKERFEAEFNA